MSRNGLLMAQWQADVLSRTLHRITGDPELLAGLGADGPEIVSLVRRRLEQELFNAGYLLRQQGDYASAMRHYWKSLLAGRTHLPSLLGMLKLLPHRLLRQLHVIEPGLG